MKQLAVIEKNPMTHENNTNQFYIKDVGSHKSVGEIKKKSKVTLFNYYLAVFHDLIHMSTFVLELPAPSAQYGMLLFHISG